MAPERAPRLMPSAADRIVYECGCGGQIDVPNKGMGRAVAAAWRTQHQHNRLVPLVVTPGRDGASTDLSAGPATPA